MAGIGIGGAGMGAVIVVFLFPLAMAGLLSWVIWPVTFTHLVVHSPNKQRLKWWLFMPLASLAGSIVGTFKAGFILWAPFFLAWRFLPMSEQRWDLPSLFYVGVGAGLSAVFSTEWIMKFDRQMHEP